MDFIELVNNLNNRLDSLNMKESKFHLDVVHSSHANTDDKIPYIKLIGYTDSILYDHATVPNYLICKVFSNSINKNVVKWINKRIFTTILNDLLDNKLTDLRTRLVRLRIGGCMAVNTAINLTKEEKEEWRNQINHVFYERAKVIADFYTIEIEQLPF